MDVVISLKLYDFVRGRDKKKVVVYVFVFVQLIVGFFDLFDLCSILYIQENYVSIILVEKLYEVYFEY